MTASPQWAQVAVPFTSLKPVEGRGGAEGPWTGTDLLEVELAGSRPGGETLWLEADDVVFY